MKLALLVEILLASLAAGVLATLVNLVIAKTAAALTKASSGFAPFTFLPIASGCFGGALLSGAVFYLLHFTFERPQMIFLIFDFIALLVSFHLPFRLTNHRSPRFAGATLAMQLTLCSMHTVVALTSVVLLLFSIR